MVLELPPSCLPFLGWVGDQPQVRIRGGRSDRVRLRTDDGIHEWTPVSSPTAARAEISRSRPFVISRRLTDADRHELEKQNIAYADAAGHLFVTDGSLLIRLHDPSVRRRTAVPESKGLGFAGVRAVQEMLADPEVPWTVSKLSAAAAMSRGRASQTLQLLEREELVRRTGRGPTESRRIRDPEETLDWLARQRQARTATPRLGCAIYADDAGDAAARASAALANDRIGHAVTGAAGAALVGLPVLSEPTAAILRIDPGIPLEHVRLLLGAIEVERGGNLLLVSDRGRFGMVAGEYPSSPGAVARPTRIYLDLVLEPRGESAAELFRDLLKGRARD